MALLLQEPWLLSLAVVYGLCLCDQFGSVLEPFAAGFVVAAAVVAVVLERSVYRGLSSLKAPGKKR